MKHNNAWLLVFGQVSRVEFNLYMDGLGDMSSSLYTMKLFIMVFKEKSLKTNCNINQTEIVEQPDQTGGMQKKGAQHYVTYVTETVYKRRED